MTDTTISVASGTVTIPAAETLTLNGASAIAFIDVNGGTAINDGSITVANATGVETYDEPDPSALFENDGTFLVTSGSLGALGVAYATIHNTSVFSVVGADSAIGGTGGLVNTGAFTVRAAGLAMGIDTYNPGSWGALVQNNAGGALTVVSSTGDAQGVLMANGGEFDNAGTLRVSGVTSAIGVYIDRAEMGYSTNYGLITNGGSIVVTGANSIGIEVSGLTDTLAAGVYNIINSGQIKAQTAIEFIGGGYSPPQSVDAAIDNSGTITGDIVLTTSANNDTILNTGRIYGDISFGGGNNSLDSSKGTISGTITLGDGNNTIIAGAENDSIFAGSGTNSIDGGGGINTVTFADFDITKVTFTHQSDGSWLMDAGGVTDTLKNIQFVKFSNGEAALGPPEVRDSYVNRVKSDILADDNGSIQVGSITANGKAHFTPVAQLGSGWSFDGSGDFLGEGRSQFEFEDSLGDVTVGAVQADHVNYTQVGTLGAGAHIIETGDFLGDGKDQFIVEGAGGALSAGEVGAGGQAAYTAVGKLAAGWTLVGSGEFLSDGHDQFLMVNTTGDVDTGEILGGKVRYSHVDAPGKAWSIVGVGDFLGAGHDEFLVANASGVVKVGDIGAAGHVTFTQVASLGSGYSFIGVGDYLGEGHDQFLVRDASGNVSIADVQGGQAKLMSCGAFGSGWTFHS